MQDETPQEEIIPSAVIPGGILDIPTELNAIIPMGTMVSPKKGQDSLGGLQAGASEVSQGSGNDIFKISSKGIHLGAANFADAPFSVDMQGNLIALSATISGTITATTGAIGGFDIGSDYIRDTANSFGLASTV